MECKNERFRHILLFYFRKGKNTAQAAKKLRDGYREEASKGNLYLEARKKDDFREFSLGSLYE